MTPTMSNPAATEDQFLGALLGLAIGDALGRPVRGLTKREISDQFGLLTSYIETDTERNSSSPGEITDKTEICLCIVESLTTNDGLLDPVNINARMTFLIRGPSRQYMSEAVVSGVGLAEAHDGQVPADRLDAPELAVAIRGVPVGLVHAVGAFDEETIRRESAVVSRLTHRGSVQADMTAMVAIAVCDAARGQAAAVDSARRPDSSAESAGPVDTVVSELARAVAQAEHFEDAVFAAVGEGGETDVKGAIAGAIAGARFGATGIPQDLIDGLDARIYLSMAAPWFFRTALRRAGTVIDLRVID